MRLWAIHAPHQETHNLYSYGLETNNRLFFLSPEMLGILHSQALGLCASV